MSMVSAKIARTAPKRGKRKITNGTNPLKSMINKTAKVPPSTINEIRNGNI